MSVLDRKLKVSINPGLINKNDAGDPELFVRGFQNVEVTPAELGAAIDEGQAFCCQVADDYRKSGNFICSDVLAIDVDGGLRIDELDQNEFVQRHLTLFYRTPSHTELQHRFRLVFALERTIRDAVEMKAAMRSLTLKLGGDRATTDAARISFGSSGANPQIFDRQIDVSTLAELIEQGRDSDQSDSAITQKIASTISRRHISPDDPVKTERNEVYPFRDIPPKTRVHCPFHYDRTPSAFVTETRRGQTCLHCSTCAQTFFQKNNDENEFDFQSFDSFVRRAHEYYLENRDYGPFFADTDSHPGLTDTTLKITNDRYFNLSELQKGLTLIKSPKGSGKTEVLKRLLQGRPTLLVGHRRSLIRQSCARLGLECYLDCESGRIRQARLGICLDSLGRLAGTGDTTRHSIVVIDEAEQVLGHFLADTLTKGESSKPRDLFLIFERILQNADYVIALDADLGWVTFETLRRIMTRNGKEVQTHLHANYYQSARKIQIFESDMHLIEDIRDSLELDKRVFVVSNSKRRVHAIEKAMKSQIPMLESLAITSDTTSHPQVADFIKNASTEALKYQLILSSPTLGTGVDITFPENAREIDVVYGFCEPLITTHFDFDQQVGRVRHPKETKIWLTPRLFRFHASRDVIRSDLHKQGLFNSILQHYDENLNPTFSEHSNFVEMASLIVSQQRSSKNQIRRHYISYKQSQGCIIEVVPEDETAADEGKSLLDLGNFLAKKERIEKLMGSITLRRDEFEIIARQTNLASYAAPKSADEEGDDLDILADPPTEYQRWCMLRTQLELFYRAPLTVDLIEGDKNGKSRQAIREFERLQKYIARKPQMAFKEKIGESLLPRFVRDNNNRTALICDLLSLTPIFKENTFTMAEYDARDLQGFAQAIKDRQAVFENLLGIEVRADLNTKTARTLGLVLRSVGLSQELVGTQKVDGRKIYRYQFVEDSLLGMQSIAYLRATTDAWETVYEINGWGRDELDLDEVDSQGAVDQE